MSFLNQKILRQIQKNLDKVAEIKSITAKHNPHKFRKLINEERRKKGVALLNRTILLDNTPKTIEARKYLPSLKQILDLKLIYGKTIPFPKFNPKIK